MNPHRHLWNAVLVTLATIAVLLGCSGKEDGGEPPPPPPPPPPSKFLTADVRVDQAQPEAIGTATGPVVRGAGANVYAVWFDYRNGEADIYFNRSADGGLSWQATDTRLDTGVNPGHSDSFTPRACCVPDASGDPTPGDDIFVVWSDNRSDDGDIYFNRSLDGGTTWLSADVRLEDTPHGAHSWLPALCCSGQNVYVAWHEDQNGDTDVYAQRSTDSGTTWMASPVRVDNDAGTAGVSQVEIACDGSTVHVIWRDNRNGMVDIFYNRSTDSGGTYGATDTLINGSPGTNFGHRIASSGNNVFVLWQDRRNGDYDIYSRVSGDAGATWGTEQRVDRAPGSASSQFASICCTGATAHVTWRDNRNGPNQTFYNRYNGGSWGASDVRLDSGTGDATRIAITCEGNNVFVAWQDSRGGDADIYLNRSTDAGGTWAGDVRIDNAPGTAQTRTPQIHVAGTNVTVVWVDWRNVADDLMSNASADGGASWGGADVAVSHDLPMGTNSDSYRPQICITDNNLCVVWEDFRPGNRGIFFNRSADEGLTWQATDVRLDPGNTTTRSNSYEPRVACSGTNVYVVWFDYRGGLSDIQFNRSTDGGATWLAGEARVDLGDAAGANLSQDPAVCCDGQNVFVAWEEARNGSPDIYFNRSTDGGVTWQNPPTRIDVGHIAGAAYSSEPQICCTGQNVRVVWVDTRNGQADIFFNASADGGQTWLPSDVRIDTGDAGGSNSSTNPVISCSGTNIYVAWDDFRNGGYDIYFNASSDGGQAWLPASVRIDTGKPAGTGVSSYPRICSEGLSVYAVWEDKRNGSKDDLYFNVSTDGGQTWLAGDVRVDTGDAGGASDADDPVIACIAGTVYASWADDRNGQNDILFNISTDGGQTWGADPQRADTDNPGAALSDCPFILASGTKVWVVWEDCRDGPHDIRINRWTP